uniref:Stimulated by retinoic acid 8 n=1 Tax=Falco tinnunculus TaxID=100819 RepID=A0A8C4UK73_FALTI
AGRGEVDRAIVLQLLMETAGACRKTRARVSPSPLTHLQEVESYVAKRRLSQARHRARLGRLFSGLREAVLSQSHNSASKVEAKSVTDVTVTFLLTAESFSLEDGNLSSLEEVREQYVKRCSLFFRYRYLYFYKHTVDLLIEHGVVCTEEVPLPEVSMTISHLWQELSEERRDSILQYCSQRDFLLDPKAACQEPACTESSVRDSGGNSEEASGSSVSTPEEVSARYSESCASETPNLQMLIGSETFNWKHTVVVIVLS